MKGMRSIALACAGLLAFSIAATSLMAQDEGVVGSQTILAGSDLWTTPPGSTFQDFSETPIPADFFGPGSDPFTGIVALKGVPNPDPTFGLTDTIVNRLGDMQLNGPGTSASVPIQIQQLGLQSVSPITVTFGGTQTEDFDVLVTLSQLQPPPPGEMLVTQNDAFGGVFDAFLPVIPMFIFRSVNGGEPLPLDFGGLLPPVTINLQTAGSPFIFDVDCPIRLELAGITTSNFAPGYSWNEINQICFCELSSEEEMLAAHGILPARFAGEPDADGDGIPDVCDNCPLTPNTDQRDDDDNRIGDLCESGPLIPPGSDLWVTPPGLSHQDFSGTPLPVPGFDPFAGMMFFEGVPIDTLRFGQTDTIVNRLQEANPSGGSATVDIEMVALSLQSVEPIALTAAGVDSFFDVFVDLSVAPHEIGSMTMDQIGPEGGTFDATLPVKPRFTFTPVDGIGDPIVVDGGMLNPPMVIDMGSNGAPWSSGGPPCAGRVQVLGFVPPAMPTADNFAVGHLINLATAKCHCLLTPEEAQLAAHGVLPARWNDLDDADGDDIPDECDNCWRHPNLDQADGDSDFIGDVCEECDFKGDNIWDNVDWYDFLNQWLQDPAGNPADVNSDGSVDILDYVIRVVCIPRDC